MPKQIGWSNESNLLYQISQQITRLINVTGTNGGGGGSITGSGTANYITRWTSSSALGNSLIYDNGTSVGIGTASPSAIFKLVIAGSINIQGGTTINNDSGSVGFYDTVGTTQTGAILFNKYTGTSILNSLNLPIKFSVNNVEAMRIDSSGKLWINRTTDDGTSSILQVNGTTSFGSSLFVNGHDNVNLPAVAGLKISYNATSNIGTIQAGKVSVAGYTLQIGGNPIIFYNSNSGSAAMRIDENNNILINRTTDDGTGSILQVVGGATIKKGSGTLVVYEPFTGQIGFSASATPSDTNCFFRCNANDTIINVPGSSGNLLFQRATYNNLGIWYSDGTLNIGTVLTIVPSSIFTVDSTNKGVLIPRMTTAQINAISSPATGLHVYNTTLQQPCFYDGSGWRKVSHTNM